MDALLVHYQQGVTTLTMNRPDRLNAFDSKLSEELIAALDEANQDDRVRVIVIAGAGRGFCSGLDLKQIAETGLPSTSRHQKLDEVEWVGRLIEGIVDNDKPVIAAVHGVAAGAGMSMALACDLRFMSSSAKLTTGYIRRGLSPDGGMTYFLPRIIGPTKAAELILTGRDVFADEALALNIVNGVYEDSSFHREVHQYAVSLAQAAPIAMTLSKRLLTHSADAGLHAHLRQEVAYLKYCFSTEDLKEGIQAMLEKRLPEFKGN